MIWCNTESNSWNKIQSWRGACAGTKYAKLSLETFGETRKRKENDTGKGSQKKRSRRSTSNGEGNVMKGKCHCVKKNWNLKKRRAWFTGSTNATGTTDSTSSVPAYSAAEFSHVRNFKKYQSETMNIYITCTYIFFELSRSAL